MTTRGGKYLPGHDAKHVANLRADVRCGYSVSEAFGQLKGSPHLHNKLAQGLRRDGWTYDYEADTWSAPTPQ